MLLKLSQNKCYIHHHFEIILFITPATKVLLTILVKHTHSEGTSVSPVLKILHFPCRWHWFNPWLGN